MIKIFLSVLMMLSISLSADAVEDKLSKKKQSCKSGSMTGCIDLGIMYFSGDGVKENHVMARKLFTKACKKRYPQACYYLATIYKRGAHGVDMDIKKARMLYGHACKIGYLKACDQYNLIRHKREVKGSGKNKTTGGYKYSPEIYSG